ncbi:MAG TPA: magnesium transporter, partial [Candidatus Hydrogenedentes bacterium]|nr:magnesium transporter [Candidatus Hydrogenedentota bacterium]
MTDWHSEEPSLRIKDIVRQGDAEALDTYLDTLSPGQVARAVSMLDDATQGRVLQLLDPGDAADLIEELSDVQGADLIEEIPAAYAAAIVDAMDSDHRVDVLAEMDAVDAEAILQKMAPEEAEDARSLLVYPDDTAGGTMVTEFLVYPGSRRVSDVLKDLRSNVDEYAEYGLHYVYVHSE